MTELTGTDRITSLLTHFLDTQSRRAQIVSSNIANVDTPGYRAKELDFAEYLKQAAYDTVAPVKGFPLYQVRALEPGVVEQIGNPIGIDGNTVDMGREMSAMAETGMRYLEGVHLLQSRLRTLRTAIREGR